MYAAKMPVGVTGGESVLRVPVRNRLHRNCVPTGIDEPGCNGRSGKRRGYQTEIRREG